MKRSTLQTIIRVLLRTLTKTEFHGLENIPTEGGVIVAFNHLSYFDAPFLFINPVRKDITALATTKYKTKSSFIGWFVETAEGIWINREEADFTAIRKATQVLKDGKAVGISTEGTRSKTNAMAKGKHGTAMLASKTQFPVVPVGVQGTETVGNKLKRLRRPHLIATFGEAFTLPYITDKENRVEILESYTEEIMCRLAALLPEKYHGYYQGNPRIKEFTA